MMNAKVAAHISKRALPDWALAGIEPMSPNSTADNMTLHHFVELLERIGNDRNQPSLAWGTGLETDYTTRGRVGRAVLGASKLGVAFRRLCDYFPLLQDATDLRLNVGPSWSTLSYKILDPDIWPRTQDALYSLGIYAALLKAAAPDAWGQVDVTVEAKPEQLRAELSSIVHTCVSYTGDANSLRFPTSALDCALNLGPAAHKLDLHSLSRDLVRKRQEMAMSERVCQLIYRDLGEQSVNQEFVAKELGVCSRTLRRRLTSEDTSFQELLDDCRMRAAALDFRIKRALSLSELALRLGYSEHSTFSRAFARWAGMSPQNYRAQVAEQSVH